MRILVVEDTKLYGRAVENALQRIGAEVVWARSFAETREAISSDPQGFDLALVDLILPDACNGEAADHCLGCAIPVIVFSGVFSDKAREHVRRGLIIDYVVKESPTSLDYLISLVEGLMRNVRHEALIVEDSRTMRKQLGHLLGMYGFEVHEADCSAAALDCLANNPGIRLMLTDYNMPDMNGMELTKKLRQRHSPQELVIIGLSSSSDNSTSARFIKYGANDFIAKPFAPEDLFFRTMNAMRMCELVEKLSHSVNHDMLTGLRSRAYFFEMGAQLMASAQREQIELTVAMLDIDHFKSFNDRYGHEAGDAVLRDFGALLDGSARKTDMAARLGGEEFALMLVNMNPAHCARYFETLRQRIGELEVIHRGQILRVSASIGVTAQRFDTLEEMLQRADELLYEAKETGRDRVVFDLPSLPPRCVIGM